MTVSLIRSLLGQHSVKPQTYHLTTMATQGKISDFFKTKPGKRNISVSSEKSSPPSKKTKLDDPLSSHGNGDGLITLSPAQKDRMDEKRLAAQILLQSKKTSALSPNVGVTWFKALQAEFNKSYFLKLSEFVEKERSQHTIYPPPEQVFSWTTMCPIQEVKVVILGQDPYHGPGQAHGLCFSVQKGVKSPPSLVNMFKELESDIDGFTVPEHGNLSGWAKQGVLLLNACLTVRAHNANSHQGKGWEEFTDAVVKWLNANSKGVVFLLWGNPAQKKGACIDKKKHHVLMCPHPSPLSAHRGFFGCGHFSKTNELLKKEGRKPIDWGLLPLSNS